MINVGEPKIPSALACSVWPRRACLLSSDWARVMTLSAFLRRVIAGSVVTRRISRVSGGRFCVSTFSERAFREDRWGKTSTERVRVGPRPTLRAVELGLERVASALVWKSQQLLDRWRWQAVFAANSSVGRLRHVDRPMLQAVGRLPGYYHRDAAWIG